MWRFSSQYGRQIRQLVISLDNNLINLPSRNLEGDPTGKMFIGYRNYSLVLSFVGDCSFSRCHICGIRSNVFFWDILSVRMNLVMDSVRSVWLFCSTFTDKVHHRVTRGDLDILLSDDTNPQAPTCKSSRSPSWWKWALDVLVFSATTSWGWQQTTIMSRRQRTFTHWMFY